MNIFVVNSGSSSIKYQLFKMPVEKPVCSGLVERIGLENSVITHKIFLNGEEKTIKKTIDLSDHEEGLKEVAALLTDPDIGVIKKPGEIEAVGHRVVHGGESFAATTIITKKVKEKIEKLFPLAPLHNPANYLGIEVAEKIFTKAKQVAVFDTAFHQTLPPKAFSYAIPKTLYTDHHIRAYGFHGTSHKYVSGKAMEYLEKQDAKLITIHLGNGCSMAAVYNGKSVDTSMGFSPLSGLVMGTRSGDIDPSIIFHLINQLGYDPEQVNTLLNKRSGMLGLTGFSDMRDIGKALQDGNGDAELALEIYAYRIKKYIGAYAAVLNGLDAIVFTAGVGENDVHTRQRICQGMQFLGLHLDEEKNTMTSSATREINSDISPVKILVIPTNEELEIAKQCHGLLLKV
jgi:acetate kinase